MFVKFLVIKTLDPNRYSEKLLDSDPDQQHLVPYPIHLDGFILKLILSYPEFIFFSSKNWLSEKYLVSRHTDSEIWK